MLVKHLVQVHTFLAIGIENNGDPAWDRGSRAVNYGRRYFANECLEGITVSKERETLP